MVARIVVFVLATVAAILVTTIAGRNTYSGPLELLVFTESPAETSLVFDAGHGFSELLRREQKVGSERVYEFAAAPNALISLHTANGLLVNYESPLERSPKDISRADGVCSDAHCLWEVSSAVGEISILVGDDIVGNIDAGAATSSNRFIAVVRSSNSFFLALATDSVRIEPGEWPTHNLRRFQTEDLVPIAVSQIDRDNRQVVWLTASSDQSGYGLAQLDRAPTPTVIAFTIGSGLLIAGLIGSLFLFGSLAVRRLRQLPSNCRNVIIIRLVMLTSAASLLLVTWWPGALGWDVFTPFIEYSAGNIGIWYGIGYPLFVASVINVWPPEAITVVQFMCTLGIFAYLALYLPTTRFSNCLFLALSIYTIAFSFIPIGMATHLRDSINGICVALFCLVFFHTLVGRKDKSASLVMGLSLCALGLTLALLRTDNLPLVLVCAAGLVLSRRHRWRLALPCVSIWFAVPIFLQGLLFPVAEHVDGPKRLYEVTAYLNPLVGYLADAQAEPRLKTDMLPVIDMVVDVSTAVPKWSPYDLNYWHESLPRRDIPSPETITALRGVYLKLAITEPIKFLQMRALTFLGMLGPPVRYFGYHFEGPPTEYVRRMTELSGYTQIGHTWPQLTDALHSWFKAVGSSIPQLAVCIFAALAFRKAPVTGIIALSILARATVFFMLSPTSLLMYLYDLHLVGVLIPALWIIERKSRRGTLNLNQNNHFT